MAPTRIRVEFNRARHLCELINLFEMHKRSRKWRSAFAKHAMFYMQEYTFYAAFNIVHYVSQCVAFKISFYKL